MQSPSPRPRRASRNAFAGAALVAILGCAAGTSPRVSDRPGPGPAPGAPGAEAALEPSPDGDPIRYHPGSQGAYRYYRLDSLDYQLPGGASQLQTYGRTAYLNVAIVPFDSAYRVHFHLDSVTQDPTTMRQPALDSVGPMSWVADMGPNGGLRNFQVTPATPFGENLSSELARRFFPAQPAGGAYPGRTWTDSSEVRIGGLSVTQTERAIIRSEALLASDSTEAYHLRIESTADLERQGSSTQTGQIIEAFGNGVDSTTYFLAEAGSFLGAQGTETFDLLFTVPAVGQSVPVHQVGRYSIARIPGDQ